MESDTEEKDADAEEGPANSGKYIYIMLRAGEIILRYYGSKARFIYFV